nr:hypothetical protein [uncultured Ottowia sp.]
MPTASRRRFVFADDGCLRGRCAEQTKQNLLPFCFLINSNISAQIKRNPHFWLPEFASCLIASQL